MPNHVGVADPAPNPWWWDVLRTGAASRYAGWFDIDWARGRLLLPVLGADDGDGALELDARESTDDELRYYEHRFPSRRAPGGGDARARCTTGSTTGWSTGGAATAS